MAEYNNNHTISSSSPVEDKTSVNPPQVRFAAMTSTARDLQVENVIASVNLGCKLDLKYIVSHARNADYNPKKCPAVLMRIRDPKSTALFYSSGKVICIGVKSEEHSRIAARKFVRIAQKLGFEINIWLHSPFQAKFQDYKILNVVGMFDMGFPILLEGLAMAHTQSSSYEPELFPGVVYRMIRPKLCLLIFASGRVVINGGKYQHHLQEAYKIIYPILKKYRKTC